MRAGLPQRLRFGLLAMVLAAGASVGETASAAEAAKPLAPAPGKDKAEQFLQQYRGSLVLVEGKTGRGSGFIGEFKGRKFLVTNAHVLAGIRDAHFKCLDNQPLKLGAAMVAVGHDVLMLTVLEGGSGIPISTSVAADAGFGDAVLVPGNAGGAGVIDPLRGQIVGIGPDRVEVSAPFEPGSSGSPIVHLDSGKVIGVATYLRINTLATNQTAKLSSLGEVRRFGYRLDSIKKWELVDWPRFYAQARGMEKEEQITTEMESALDDLVSSSRRQQQKHVYESRVLGNAVDLYDLALTQNPGSSVAAARNLLACVRATGQDNAGTRSSFTYDYFRREYDLQQERRKDVVDAFEKVIENFVR